MLLDFSTLLPRERKIAVTGIAGGGKTVFLTSLLSHLIEHDAQHFVFGDHAKIKRFREVPVSAGYGGQFRLDAYRDSLARRQQWPAKTTDCAHYRCEFERSDWAYRKARLHFFDLPGERIADALVAAHEDFAKWSDAMLQHLRDTREDLPEVQAYLDLQKDKNVDEAELVTAYKRLLAALIFHYKPLVSPSTFLLSQDGEPAHASDPEELVESRDCGLPGKPFAPMSKKLREKQPELFETMVKHYKAYRREIALPVFNELKDCGRLIVLVDIPSLLLGGVGRYNDNRDSVYQLFEALRPSSNIGQMLLSLFGVRKMALKRVAFVAAKADTVLPDDVESGRLIGLLRSMTERARQLLPNVTCEWFSASACVSTRSDPKNTEALIGLTPYEENEIAFEVSRLPQDWPAGWAPGDFAFSRVEPQAPRNLQIPPPHLGLDRIFDFISGD